MMSYGSFGDYRRRRRRAAFWRAARLLLFALAFGLSASYAYQVGLAASQARAHKLEADLERFQADNLRLREGAATAARQTEEAQAALAALRERYRLGVPQGELADLFAHLQRQIEAGVPAARIGFLIEAAGQDAPCAADPEIKRFVVQTSSSRAPVSAVRLGGSRILLTGAGEPAHNEAGLVEAWFDPAQPVALTFQTLDGSTQHVAGLLPLRHAMIVDGMEYRFSIIAGARSLVEVSAQACPLPAPPGAQAAKAQDRPAGTAGRLVY